MVHMTEQQAGLIPAFHTGDRLRKSRELTGLDQTEFADQLGVSRGTISNYENSATAKRKPIVMRAWALATGVPLAWLETGEGTSDPTPPLGRQAVRDPNSELTRLANRKRPTGGAPDSNGRYSEAA